MRREPLTVGCLTPSNIKMPEVHFISCPVDADSFLITPAIVITQGRDDNEALMPGFLIQVQWLMWGFGVCISF